MYVHLQGTRELTHPSSPWSVLPHSAEIAPRGSAVTPFFVLRQLTQGGIINAAATRLAWPLSDRLAFFGVQPHPRVAPVVWGGAAWATSLPPRSAGAAPRRAFSCMTPDISTSLATPPLCFMGGYPETCCSSVAFVFSLLCPLAKCKPSLPPSLCLCFLVFRSFVFSPLSELRAVLGVPVFSHTCRAVSLQACCPARLGSSCLRTRDLASNSVRR